MLSLKDLTPMYCVGYWGYDDEWHPDSRYKKYLKIDKHHYHIHLFKRRKNNWGLRVYLCLTALNSDDVLVVEKSAKTMKELKQVAVDEINAYHNTYRCIFDIQRWKETHGKKVYDKDFNYLGISYTTPARDKDDSEFDYYNDQKINVGCGIYYMLEENSVCVCDIGCWGHSMHWDKSEELRQKLIAN